MPGGERRNVARREERLDWLQSLAWTDHQLRAFQRADRLRYVGADRQAEMLVAQECPLPWAEHRITARDLPFARNLDVHRWYLAFTGRHWNGQADSFGRARNLANRRAHEVTYDATLPQPRPKQHALGLRAFRTCHLLVEPLEAHPFLDELRDFTHLVGWPSGSYVGHLHWQDNNGDECAFCAALLLPSEAHAPWTDARGVVCGKHCCSKGYVARIRSVSPLLSSACRTPAWTGKWTRLLCRTGPAG